MINKNKKIIILFLSFFLFIGFCTKVHSNSSYKIVVLIDEEPITNYDLLKEIAYMNIISLGKITEFNQENINKIAIESLIKERVKKKEIKKFNIPLDDTLVELEMDSLIEKISQGNENKVNELIENGIFKKDDLFAKISIELRWNKLIGILFNEKVVINEKEINEKLKKFSENKKINEYLIFEIFIDAENQTKLKKKLEETLLSINQVGFKNTAIKFSSSESAQQGGRLGWINESHIDSKLLEEIKKIEPGKVSEPIVTPSGFLLLKVEEKKTSEKKINFKKDLQKLIINERNKQLKRFGINHLNKIKINSKIKHL